MEAVVRLSRDMGFHGRVGLLAYPTSESFYKGCLMTPVDGVVQGGGMILYEMTPGHAVEFLDDD